MRNQETYFRKPVEFAQLNVILCRSHGSNWVMDCATWNEAEARQLEKEAKGLYGLNNVKLVTSPSDNETVLARIIKEMNK